MVYKTLVADRAYALKKSKHEGFITDEVDKKNIQNQTLNNPDLVVLDRSREIVRTEIKMGAPSKFADDQTFDFTELKLSENFENKTIFVSKAADSVKIEGHNIHDTSMLTNIEFNESYISIKNKHNMSYNQRANLSTDEYSSQTYYPTKPDRNAYLSTSQDDENSIMFPRPTDESQLEAVDENKTFSKIFRDDSREKLNKLSKTHHQLVKEYQSKRDVATAFFIKKRMLIDRQERIDEIKDFKLMNKSMLSLFTENNKAQKSLHVQKAREIKSIMKREQTEERERNLRMLSFLSKKEKYINREVKTQHVLLRKNKNLITKSMVQKINHRNAIHKEERNFINNFTQAKNIIEKQMFKGKMIKERRNIKIENKIKKQAILQTRSFQSHQAIPSKVFDTAISQPTMFNSFMDEDVVTTMHNTIQNRENLNAMNTADASYK